MYFNDQPEPAWSDAEAEKQFHHCYRFYQAICFAVLFTTVHRQLSGEAKPTMDGGRCYLSVLDAIYYGPHAVQFCWFGGCTAAKLYTPWMTNKNKKYLIITCTMY